jgi:hypothetical protein
MPYSTPVLALVFLKYADHKFAQVEAELAAKQRRRRQVSKDDYLARGVLFDAKCEAVYESYHGDGASTYRSGAPT